MDGMVKSYDYEQVMTFTGSGGTLDNTLRDIQTKVKELRVLVDECQEYLHGQTEGQGLHAAYQKYYNMIGTPQTGGSFWAAIDNARMLIDKMYTRAKHDLELEEGE